MNRGSVEHTCNLYRISLRFNEAPIHESGKFSAARYRQETLKASMRPRFMNRGSPGLMYPFHSPLICFNEAPIHESGKFEAA